MATKTNVDIKSPKGVSTSIVDLSNLDLDADAVSRIGNRITEIVLAEYAAQDRSIGLSLGGRLGKFTKWDPEWWGIILIDEGRIDSINDIPDLIGNIKVG